MQAHAAPISVNIEQIVPFYQPIFSLANQRVVRYECLARMLDTHQQVILPNDFLYIVEQNEDAAHMTSRILELSKAYCCPRQMSWSINLFTSDLSDTQLLKDIETLCVKSAKGLCGIELHYQNAKENLIWLRNLKKRMPKLHITVDEIDSIDEVLYSVIASGIDALKLRADVIEEYADSEKGIALVSDTKAHCAEHGVRLIAEHIETDNMLKAVKAADIEYGQGFYLSHPMPKVYAVHSV